MNPFPTTKTNKQDDSSKRLRNLLIGAASAGALSALIAAAAKRTKKPPTPSLSLKDGLRKVGQSLNDAFQQPNVPAKQAFATPIAKSAEQIEVLTAKDPYQGYTILQSAFDRTSIPEYRYGRLREIPFEDKVKTGLASYQPKIIRQDRQSIQQSRDFILRPSINNRYLITDTVFKAELLEQVNDRPSLYRALQTEGFLSDILNDPSQADRIPELKQILDRVLSQNKNLFEQNYRNFLESMDYQQSQALKAYFDADAKRIKALANRSSYDQVSKTIKQSIYNQTIKLAEQSKNRPSPEAVQEYLSFLSDPSKILGEAASDLSDAREIIKVGSFNLNHLYWKNLLQNPKAREFLSAVPKESINDAVRRLTMKMYAQNKVKELQRNSRLMIVPVPYLSVDLSKIKSLSDIASEGSLPLMTKNKPAFVRFSAINKDNKEAMFKASQPSHPAQGEIKSNYVTNNPLKNIPRNKSNINYSKNPFSFISSNRKLIPNLVAIQRHANTSLPRSMRFFS